MASRICASKIEHYRPGLPLDQAFARILENDAGCLLVVAAGQLLGIVTERDLLEAAVTLVPAHRR